MLQLPQRQPLSSASREKRKVQTAMALPPELRQRTPEFSLNPQTLKQFKVNVTLDPDTAGPELILSEDLKGARWGKPSQEMPDSLERFDTDPCVLGCEGFTSGRHYWEVEVDGMFWTVGVASESVRRKGHIVFRPNTESWVYRNIIISVWRSPTLPTPMCPSKRTTMRSASIGL
ncbi:E3 ubiquitin-protein ligase TRIM11-like isoform X2 [Dermochelys coriacea]|uniref:E3 ubiquitin-protein ligase TRIM11-like isoform X2 n=1 Tax=Dermochelys coriacea TaxID=27794 RepID=UPI0018E733FA|nr:E3 ubiquitin-protein ligase TRIM11-like isoform X2 [Dermochelys coriacea]